MQETDKIRRDACHHHQLSFDKSLSRTCPLQAQYNKDSLFLFFPFFFIFILQLLDVNRIESSSAHPENSWEEMTSTYRRQRAFGNELIAHNI